jgi:glycerol uptake facilitator-like aquaporin
MRFSPLARVTAEFVGTAFLLMAVVGSGIMGERLAGGNIAIALLANTVATGAALVALILTFGPVSGAHLNPSVTLADASQRGILWREVPGYVVCQSLGAFVGVACAHLMFGLPLFSTSRHARSGPAQVFSEFVATFGLMSVIWGCSRLRSSMVPFAVGAYITAAYWFTASTSFANPAVTLARCFTNTFAGIRPADAPGFIAAQFIGALGATVLFRWLRPTLPETADEVLVPHPGKEVGVRHS